MAARRTFMLRKSFVGLMAVLLMATASQAAIILDLIGPTDVGQGFAAWTLHAHSDSPSQTINGVDTPSIVSGGSSPGLPHQVWLNNTGVFKSITAGDQTPGLWNSAYTPFDSFWYFDSTNSLSVGAAFDEANNGTNGATGLPAGPLGNPYTGFGAMGTIGGAPGARAFTIASGRQGQDVDFARIVLKLGTSVIFNGTILTNEGNNQAIQGLVLPIFAEPSSAVLLGVAAIVVCAFRRR
jgi:hypothetical protein